MTSRKTVIKDISVIVCAVMVLAAITSCGGANDSLAPFKDNGVAIGMGESDTGYFPGYVHYDPSAFYKKCDSLSEMMKRENADASELFTLYDELYGEAVMVLDYKWSAKAGLDENMQSEYFTEETIYVSDLEVEMTDRIKTVGKSLASGQYSSAFKEHLNNDLLFESYADYEPLTGEVKELLNREAELQNEYLAATDEINAASYGGSFDYKAANDRIGKIFIEQISVRKELASELGYDDYTEYADREVYRRDYTEKDLNTLKKVLKKYGSEILYYYYVGFPDTSADEVDTDTIICDVGEIVSSFSAKADEAYTFLTNNGLLSAGSESCRSASNYTNGAFSTDSAYILLQHSAASQLYNYRTFAHELGHFAHMNLVKNPYPLFSEEGCIDVMELHSHFLEILFSMKTGDLLSNQEYFPAFELATMAGIVAYGCIYDDWQRAIYKSEKELTIDEINSLFKDISIEYGLWEYDTMEYEWIWIPHNFTLPMYYISYATSAFAALQVWVMAQTDFNSAVSTWEKSLLESPYSEGYLTALSNIGLENFTNQGTAEKVFKEIVDFLNLSAEEIYGTESE